MLQVIGFTPSIRSSSAAEKVRVVSDTQTESTEVMSYQTRPCCKGLEAAQPFPGYSVPPLPVPAAQPQLSSTLTHPVLHILCHISLCIPHHSSAPDLSRPKLTSSCFNLPSSRSAQDNAKVVTTFPPSLFQIGANFGTAGHFLNQQKGRCTHLPPLLHSALLSTLFSFIREKDIHPN